ncbi:MAG: NUDIX domain-containing protein, partial [Chloroflexota bacterium]
MLVQPSSKPIWEITGSVVEVNESPLECCQCEVQEEFGLNKNIGRLLVVDYAHETEEKTEALMFIFWGGTLSDTEISQIKLPP